MSRSQRTGFFIVAGLLLAFLAIFPVLAIDAIAKLIANRAGLETGNFALILFLEGSRAFTTVIALVASLILALRFSDKPYGRALTFFVVFLALTYEKIFGSISYPGPLQEKLTLTLLDAGVSRAGLAWLFGPLAWSVWPALAAIIRFSVVFPHPLSPEAIDAAAAGDRRGMLRDAGVAGVDIGALFRRLSKRALGAGMFKPQALLLAAIVLIVITTILGRSASKVLVVAGVLLALAVVITNLRAAYRIAAPGEKARIHWLWLGFMGAATLFAVAAVPLLVLDDPVTTVAALVLLALAPAVIMICMVVAVTRPGDRSLVLSAF